MFSWLRKRIATPSGWPAPSKVDWRELGIRNNIFFRLDAGPLRDVEIATENEDVPRGAPILQHLCYELPFPWCAHEITISVWCREITAKIAKDSESIYGLYFSDWDDGWLLSIDPPEDARKSDIHEIVGAIDRFIVALPYVRDVRWFRDGVLTCGMFHEHDFQLGTLSPFTDRQPSK